MRRLLDTLYLAGGMLAAAAIVAICLLVSAQVGLNILARIGGPAWSFTIPSYADFAGYFLASASFLALAHTLREGGHIRVNLVLQHLKPRARWCLEVVVLLLSTAIAAYALWFAAALMAESWHYGDKSTGIVAIPLWIPQGVMVAGLLLLVVALADTLVQSLRAGTTVITDTGAE